MDEYEHTDLMADRILDDADYKRDRDREAKAMGEEPGASQEQS